MDWDSQEQQQQQQQQQQNTSLQSRNELAIVQA
jgi:hypothetical protein